MSHSYGILQGKAFKKLLRSVMQQANDGKKKGHIRKSKGVFDDIKLWNPHRNQTW